jgi:hypothetical protein
LDLLAHVVAAGKRRLQPRKNFIGVNIKEVALVVALDGNDVSWELREC